MTFALLIHFWVAAFAGDMYTSHYIQVHCPVCVEKQFPFRNQRPRFGSFLAASLALDLANVVPSSIAVHNKRKWVRVVGYIGLSYAVGNRAAGTIHNIHFWDTLPGQYKR